MPVIGVTGSFGSGKSMVAGMFQKQGAFVFDADKAVHDLLERNRSVIKSIAAEFGPEVLSLKGIDHSKLAAIVFDDKHRMKRLTDIVHPIVRREEEKFIRSCARCSLIVLDVPLLLESGWASMVDCVVVVKARRDQQLDRVKARSGISARQAVKRIRRQWPLGKKLKYADYVVDNSGSPFDTNKQVIKIIEDLLNPDIATAISAHVPTSGVA